MLAHPQPRPASTTTPQDLFSTQSYFAPPTPPPVNPKRPSITAAMNWLSSHKTNNSITSLSSSLRGNNRSRSNSVTNRESQSQSQPVRISEPYSLRDELGNIQPRARASGRQLGHGAEIINTPAEALDRGAIASPPSRRRDLPPIPQSPPAITTLRSSKSSPHLKSPTRESMASEYSPVDSPPRTSKPASMVPSHVVPPLTPFSTPPALSTTPLPLSDQCITIPPPASHAPFEAVLISTPFVTSSFTKPSQTVVTLETCTETFRTTLSTLTSRPSALSEFIESLKEHDDGRSDASSSVPSSPFTRAFADHLTGQGLQQSQSPSNRLHIFLDRPSSPYAHILNYLRSPAGVLPRAVHLGENVCSTTSYDAMKLDALLELRDEATFVGLDELAELCETEMKRWIASSSSPPPTRRRNTPSPVLANSRPNSSGSVTLRSREATPSSKPRALRHSPSASGLRPLAVPSSIHETENSPSILATEAPWSEFGMRASLSISDESHGEQQQGGSIGPPPKAPLPETPAPLAPQTVGGLKERVTSAKPARSRSRSHPRSESSSTTGRVSSPPTRPTLASAKTVRGNSFLPSLASPQTPRTASSGNWI